MINNSPIVLLKSNVNVKPLQEALEQNNHLWNQNTLRTAFVNSPFAGTDDIWARFVPMDTDYTKFAESVWYPGILELLPIEQLAEEVLKIYPGKLGSILITRIHPGGEVKAHIDTGWHSLFYDKIAVMIHSNKEQAFRFEITSLISNPGDAFYFDNSLTHWVTNNSDEARVTAIFCIRPIDKV